jgi:hypothetical protein
VDVASGDFGQPGTRRSSGPIGALAPAVEGLRYVDMKLCIAATVLVVVSSVLSASQSNTGPAERTLTLPASSRQPALTFRITARDSVGAVEVSGEASGTVPPQTLSCTLESPFAAELFVREFAAEDLDFDGYKDARGVRDFGAKWKRYCVWLFDPQSQRFVKDFLAQQMELLVNLEPDSKGQRIVSSTIGPVEPEWNVFHIVATPAPSVARQLIPVQMCSIHVDDLGRNPTAVVTRFQNGHAVTQRHPLDPSKDQYVEKVCDSFQVPRQ